MGKGLGVCEHLFGVAVTRSTAFVVVVFVISVNGSVLHKIYRGAANIALFLAVRVSGGFPALFLY